MWSSRADRQAASIADHDTPRMRACGFDNAEALARFNGGFVSVIPAVANQTADQLVNDIEAAIKFPGNLTLMGDYNRPPEPGSGISDLFCDNKNPWANDGAPPCNGFEEIPGTWYQSPYDSACDGSGPEYYVTNGTGLLAAGWSLFDEVERSLSLESGSNGTETGIIVTGSETWKVRPHLKANL